MYFISNWYCEIINTYLALDVENNQPKSFEFKTMLPFDSINMDAQNRQDSEANKYLKEVKKYLQQ